VQLALCDFFAASAVSAVAQSCLYVTNPSLQGHEHDCLGMLNSKTTVTLLP